MILKIIHLHQIAKLLHFHRILNLIISSYSLSIIDHFNDIHLKQISKNNIYINKYLLHFLISK